MKTSYLPLSILVCILISFSACNDDEQNPLRFYNNAYEVPMGGIRYLGLESGNGNYSLEIGDIRIASAQSESGWTTPGGSAIYVHGILTGNTSLKVTDNATQESSILQIKVTDNYEALRLHHKKDEITSLLSVSDLFLVNNNARDVYFFRQSSAPTAFSDGLELITKGKYDFEQSNGQSYLTLTYAPNTSSPATSYRFIVPDIPYLLHRLNKNLNLGWDTLPINNTRTSEIVPPSYELQEDTEAGNKVSFQLTGMQIPEGILP